MLTVKFEQMYPIREYIVSLKFDDRGLTVKQVTEKVERHIETNLHRWVERFPSMTELRWEYEEYGQGHYLPVVADEVEIPFSWIGKPNYQQLIDIAKRAMAFEDWKMVEQISYLIRLRQDCPYEVSSPEIELPYAIYCFDWMKSTDYEGKLEEVDDEPLSEEFMNDMEELAIIEQDTTSNTAWDDPSYRKLRLAFLDGQILFESEHGQEVTDPFHDESLRFEVDPIKHYGRAALEPWLNYSRNGREI